MQLPDANKYSINSGNPGGRTWLPPEMKLPDANSTPSNRTALPPDPAIPTHNGLNVNEHTQQVPEHDDSLPWRPLILFFLAVLLVSVIWSPWILFLALLVPCLFHKDD